MTNQKIRQVIEKHRIKYYEVAEALEISSSTFSVWLRKEFTPEQQQKVLKAINEVLKGVGNG